MVALFADLPEAVDKHGRDRPGAARSSVGTRDPILPRFAGGENR